MVHRNKLTIVGPFDDHMLAAPVWACFPWLASPFQEQPLHPIYRRPFHIIVQCLSIAWPTNTDKSKRPYLTLKLSLWLPRQFLNRPRPELQVQTLLMTVGIAQNSRNTNKHAFVRNLAAALNMRTRHFFSVSQSCGNRANDWVEFCSLRSKSFSIFSPWIN